MANRRRRKAESRSWVKRGDLQPSKAAGDALQLESAGLGFGLAQWAQGLSCELLLEILEAWPLSAVARYSQASTLHREVLGEVLLSRFRGLCSHLKVPADGRFQGLGPSFGKEEGEMARYARSLKGEIHSAVVRAAHKACAGPSSGFLDTFSCQWGPPEDEEYSFIGAGVDSVDPDDGTVRCHYDVHAMAHEDTCLQIKRYQIVYKIRWKRVTEESLLRSTPDVALYG